MNELSVVKSGQSGQPGIGVGFACRTPKPKDQRKPRGRAMLCPLCDRRALDVSASRPGRIEAILKCPQCGKFVTICIRNPMY